MAPWPQGPSLQLPLGAAPAATPSPSEAPSQAASPVPAPAPSAPPASPCRAVSPRPGPRGGIVVFSGGSAANSLVDVFERLREANRTSLSYVLPISDNGGSTSEIIRVFGGPGACPDRPLQVT